MLSFLSLLNDLLSGTRTVPVFKDGVKVPMVSNRQKNLKRKNLFFAGILKARSACHKRVGDLIFFFRGNPAIPKKPDPPSK
jgi:hypothetical protein